MNPQLSEDSLLEVKQWVEENIQSGFALNEANLNLFLSSWLEKNYPEYPHFTFFATSPFYSDQSSYFICAYKHPKFYDVYCKTRFTIQSEFASQWISYLIDNNVFSFRIACNLFGVDVIKGL